LSLNKAMVETLVNARYGIMLLLSCKTLNKTAEPHFKQLEEQLWLSPALVDASLAQLAAWCQYHYFQHSNKQQQEQGKEGEVCKQKLKLQKQGGTGSSHKSSRTRSPGLGSSSSNSIKVADFHFASASSWSELQVLPDHEQVVVAGGQAAVAAHLWRLARVHERMPLSELLMELLSAAKTLRWSLLPGVGLQEGEKEPLPGDVRLSRRPAATNTALQLALEGVACKGIQVEAALAGLRESVDSSRRLNLVWQAGSSPSSALGMDAMIQLLYQQFKAADSPTRRSFLAARGGYVLQVMWLVTKMAVEQQQQRELEQQQQPHQQDASDLAVHVATIMFQVSRGPDGERILLPSERSKFENGKRALHNALSHDYSVEARLKQVHNPTRAPL
jgi:hypothetical protein